MCRIGVRTEQEAQALREYLKGYGMEIKETEPKDPNEQLEANTYSYDNLHAVIRSGSADDVGVIAEVMERESDAQDPAKAIRNAVSGEFRKEYVELVMSGQTAKANELAKKLAVVGIDEEDLGDWVKDERYDSIKTHVAAGDAHKARAQSEALLDSGVKISSLVSSLNSRFKDEYVELVLTGQTAKANDLAETLQALDLYWKDGKTNYYRQEALDDWVKDSKK